MKIVFLNIWAGRVRDVYSYLASLDADVYMLQEVVEGNADISPFDINCLENLRAALPYHEHSFFVAAKDKFLGHIKHGVRWGLAAFWRKGMKAEEVEAGWFIKEGSDTGIYQILDIDGLGIMNIHGWWKHNKHDSEETLLQSRKIISMMQDWQFSVIGGDFNLLPGTRSIQMIEDAGWYNLIRMYGIKKTRSRLADKKMLEEGVVYSDYVFTKGVDVRDFNVPEVEVSDHLPLIVEIER